MSIFFRSIFATFLVLTFVMSAFAGGPANGLEAAVAEQMAAVRASWPQLTRIAATLTKLGGAPVTLGIAAAASLWLLLWPAPGRAFLLASTVILERLMVDGFKEWIGRPRPPLDILPHSLAFPSGHSANSMTAFVATALLACPPAHRRVAVIAALFAAFVIGLTRVFLGVHWPSDVIGGWAFGLLAVTVALIAGKRLGLLSLEAQHDIVGGHRPAAREDESA
jgi:membrane-associated phospholipid phosphatase